MANRLADLLQNKQAAPLRWIEPNGYATQAFAGGKQDWQAQAQSCSSVLAQANSALKSQVLSLDIEPALFLDAPAADAKNALSIAETVLGSDGPANRALQVAKAVEQTLSNQIDLVLRLPSPAALLHRCGVAADAQIDFDDLDDAAVALAGLVRKFSECKISGLMLATDISAAGAEDEFDTLGAIVSTAKHYRWVTALRIDGAVDAATAAKSGVDFALFPNAGPGAFAQGWSQDSVRLGGGLSHAFWRGEDFAEIPDNALLYGDAPGDIAPEQVLERAARLGT